MRRLLLVIGIVLAALLGWALWLPAEHSVSGTAEFDADLAAVWEVYTDFASQPQWRSEVSSIEFTDETGTAWIETVNPGAVAIHMQVLELRPPTRLVLRTGSPGRFEGRYVAEFAESASGVTGSFTETSVALGLVPKVMRALFVDGQALIERYSEQAQAEIRRRAAGPG